MTTKRDRKMQEVYSVYNAIKSCIFMCTCWIYSHGETPARGHDMFKISDFIVSVLLSIHL
jgi:hypothetical protein